MATVKQVNYQNQAWRGDLLTKYHALLVGGSMFDGMKKDFLLKKPTECQMPSIRSMPGSGSTGEPSMSMAHYMPVMGATDHYTYRMNKTAYKPILPSLFGYLAAQIFPVNPIIETDNQDILDLLECADGERSPLIKIVRESLINALTYSTSFAPCGSYIQLFDDGDGIIKMTNNTMLSTIDWGDDWVKTRTVTPERDEKYGPITRNKWTWTIYTPDEIKTYIGYIKIESRSGIPQKIDEETTETNQLGICPFIRVNLAEHQYLMDQLAPAIIEQFNLESDIASLCGKISNAQLIMKTNNKDLGTIVLPQLGAIILDPGDDVKFESPNPACCEPLFKHRQALRDGIYNSINASVMRASADFVQNPRQSATAKELDLAPWKAWSETFALPVKSAMECAINCIADFYGTEAKIEWGESHEIDMEGVKEAIEPEKSEDGENGEENI